MLNTDSNQQLTIGTVARFLLFNRKAIYAVAASKSSFWVGLMFVLAAGFAREYDGEYLIAEPWHLFLPVLASLIGCLFLVVLVFVFLRCQGESRASAADVARSFLHVYWMTAPLALLYGIPFERMFDPFGATRANLWLLGVVAVWRVLLTIRCVHVLCETSPLRAVFPVMLFSDILALAALNLAPGPVFMIMGGVRLSESEQLILGIRNSLGILSFLTLPIWFFGMITICATKQSLCYYRFDDAFFPVSNRAATGLWAVAIISILIWLPWLPHTQHEQRLRYQAEQHVGRKDYEALVRMAIENPHASFPPHWDPPPRIGYGESVPDVYSMLEQLLKLDPNNWMVGVYSDKLLAQNEYRAFAVDDSSNSDDRLEQIVNVLEKLPNGQAIARYKFRHRLRYPEDGCTERRRKLIDRIREFIGPDDEY